MDNSIEILKRETNDYSKRVFGEGIDEETFMVFGYKKSSAETGNKTLKHRIEFKYVTAETKSGKSFTATPEKLFKVEPNQRFENGGGVGKKIDLSKYDFIDKITNIYTKGGKWYAYGKRYNAEKRGSGYTKEEALEDLDLHLSYVSEKDKYAKGGEVESISSLGRSYLGELWFSVYGKETSKYKSLANKLDKEGVPMYIQNEVSYDASNTTKKHIDTYEVKDRIDKILSKNKYAKGGLTDKVKISYNQNIRYGKGYYVTAIFPKGTPESVVMDKGREMEVLDLRFYPSYVKDVGGRYEIHFPPSLYSKTKLEKALKSKLQLKTTYAKGGEVKTKKFPIAVQRRIDDINTMLPKVLDADSLAGGYQGSTMYSYVALEKPIEVKNQFVYIYPKMGNGFYEFEKRYNVNDNDEWSSNGRKQLMYDLSVIKRAFISLLKDEGIMAKGGVVVTSIKDIPNFKQALKDGKITYRGLGMGKLANDFYKLAGTNGTRIKVDGKEYFITDKEFDSFSRDKDGRLIVRFDAPKRRFNKGGSTDVEESYHEKVRWWIKQNTPQKFHNYSLDEIPLRIFNDRQKKERNELLREFDSLSVNNFSKGGSIKWQDVEEGDSAIVKEINKMGLIIKAYGRKFHLKFPSGTEKTYDASDLEFVKNDKFENGGGVGEIKVGDKVNLPEIKMPNGSVQFERVENGEVKYINDGIYGVYNPKTRRMHQVRKDQIVKYSNGGGVWTKKQREMVDKLDAEFLGYLKEKNINRYSYEASIAWREGGFKKRMAEIFNKTYSNGGEIRYVEEFDLSDGIQISKGKSTDGKTWYSSQVNLYPYHKFIPMREDKQAVEQRAKKVYSEMEKWKAEDSKGGKLKNMRKKLGNGGSLDNTPKIYVADLAAYNEGKLIGEWLDLSDYSSGSEVMDAIQELLEKWSKEQGVEREEYAIHDMEFIPSNLESEWMGEETFDKIIEITNVAENIGVPTEVITDWMSDSGYDDPSNAEDAYYGRYDDEEDFAYELVEQGIYTPSVWEMYVSKTDMNLIAGEDADFRIEDMSDEEILEQAGNLSEYEDLESEIEDLESEQLDLDSDSDKDLERDEEIVNLISENEDKIKELEKEKDELLNRSKEDLRDEFYDAVYDRLDNDLEDYLSEMGYTTDSLPSFVIIDYKRIATELGFDYDFITHDGETYVFSRNFAKGGKLKNMRKKLGNGGSIGSDEIVELIKDSVENLVEDIDISYEIQGFNGEYVETKSRDGFIPFTDGGYTSTGFTYISYLHGSGYSLPTDSLDKELERQVQYNYDLAKERFTEEYPEIVKEIGEDKVNYSDLYELGYSDEAEQLSEWEMDFDGEDSVMFEIGGYYYSSENSRAENGKNTILMFAVVNLESPYHRRGNLEDFKEIKFTFDSKKELEQKLQETSKSLLNWVNGGEYKSGRELKITRMSNGGKLKNMRKKRSTHAISQDRKRLSSEPHEQAYLPNRKTDYYTNKWFKDGGGVGDVFSLSKTTMENGRFIEMVIAENVSVADFERLFTDKGYIKRQDTSLVGFYFVKPNGDTIQLIPSFHKKGEIIKYANGGSVESKIATLEKGLSNPHLTKEQKELVKKRIEMLKGDLPKKEVEAKAEPKKSAPKKAVKKSAPKKATKKATTRKKQTPVELAKEIRKDGEKWTDAVKRAAKILKGETPKETSGKKKIVRKKATETKTESKKKTIKRKATPKTEEKQEPKKSAKKVIKRKSAPKKATAKKKVVKRTERALKQDKSIKALHTGKRISKDGNVYYEYRENHSDIDRRKKLEDGGQTWNDTKGVDADFGKGGRMYYSNDPKIISSKFDTSCAETGKRIKKGEDCVYYPKDKSCYSLDSKQAEEFRKYQQDLDMGYNYGNGGSVKKSTKKAIKRKK